MGRHHENVNIIPAGPYDLNGSPRKVQIGFRPIGKQGFGHQLSEVLGAVNNLTLAVLGKATNAPNPAYHWSVIVDGWVHHLQSTAMVDGWNYYENKKYTAAENWQLFEVGETAFNDNSIRSASEQAILEMPEKYHFIQNNCQRFAIKLLDIICRSGRTKLRTNYSLTTLQIAFVPGQEEGETVGEEVEVAVAAEGENMMELLKKANEIMQKNTPKLTKEEVANA